MQDQDVFLFGFGFALEPIVLAMVLIQDSCNLVQIYEF